MADGTGVGGKRGICFPPDFGRSVNSIALRGADISTKLLLAPRIFRPSVGSDLAYLSTM